MHPGISGSDASGKKSLRLAAWAWIAKGKPGETWNPFRCEQYCGEHGENTQERIARGCTRTDLPPVEWDVDADRIAFNVGARDRGAEPVADGCPGGYQRSVLVGSIDRYYRRRDDHGGRVANPHLDRIDDFLVLDAVLYREAEEERCRNENALQWAADRGDA
jgi:hypothetical protein